MKKFLAKRLKGLNLRTEKTKQSDKKKRPQRKVHKKQLHPKLLKVFMQTPTITIDKNRVNRIKKKKTNRNVQLHQIKKETKEGTDKLMENKKLLEKFIALNKLLPFLSQRFIHNGKVVKQQNILKQTKRRITSQRKPHI